MGKGLLMSVNMINLSPSLSAFLSTKEGGMMRDYQVHAIKEFHEFMASPSKWFSYLVYPTGTGKTRTVKGIMNSYRKGEKKFIFVTPTRALADQTWEGEEHQMGIWYGNRKKSQNRANVIMVINTLINKVKSGEINLKWVDTIFLDEFHTYNSEWVEGQPENAHWLMMQCRAVGCKIVGMTGTPYDKNGDELILPPDDQKNNHLTSPEWRDIKSYIGRMYGEIGVLATPLYRVVGNVDRSKLRKANNENGINARDEEEAILKSRIDEAGIIKKFHRAKSIVVCRSIAHTEELVLSLQLIGMKVGMIHSQMKDPRKELRDFREGVTDILLSVNMLTTGIDIPSADTIFLARVIGSQSIWRQSIGRVLRWIKDKIGVIIDMYNTLAYLGGHFLDDPVGSEQKEEFMKAPPKLCQKCKEPTDRVKIKSVMNFDVGINFVTFACKHCGDESEEKKAIPTAECPDCKDFPYITNVYRHKNYMVCDCDCGAKVKLEKIVDSKFTVAYRDRTEAISLLSQLYAEKIKAYNYPKDEEFIKEVSRLFLHTKKDNIVEALGVVDIHYGASWKTLSKMKMRAKELNKELDRDKSRFATTLKSLIFLKKEHLIDAVFMAKELGDEIGIDDIPTYPELEKMMKNKRRGLDSMLKSYYTKLEKLK